MTKSNKENYKIPQAEIDKIDSIDMRKLADFEIFDYVKFYPDPQSNDTGTLRVEHRGKDFGLFKIKGKLWYHLDTKKGKMGLIWLYRHITGRDFRTTFEYLRIALADYDQNP